MSPGFRFQWKSENVDVPLMNEKRTGYVSSLTKDEWIWHKMHSAALAVQNDRKLSEYIQAGSVAAAVLSASGKIYTGVCVDTSCTLGICAERNAIFNMITNGEQEIKKVLAVMPEGGNGAINRLKLCWIMKTSGLSLWGKLRRSGGYSGIVPAGFTA